MATIRVIISQVLFLFLTHSSGINRRVTISSKSRNRCNILQIYWKPHPSQYPFQNQQLFRYMWVTCIPQRFPLIITLPPIFSTLMAKISQIKNLEIRMINLYARLSLIYLLCLGDMLRKMTRVLRGSRFKSTHLAHVNNPF